MFQTVRNRSGRIVRVIGYRGSLARIAKLRIPPAWVDVQVDPRPGAKILATGYDVAGRKQAIYSPEHTAAARDDKFAKVRELIDERDAVRAEIELDVKCRDCDWREEATVAYLIYETGIRPGSRSDTRAAKKALGATTLQARHVKVMSSGRVWLDFTGKKGVRIKVLVTNPWLVNELKRRKRAANGAYTTPLFDTNDGWLRDYFATISDGSYTPKDFRTMRGTVIARELLDKRRVPRQVTKRKKIVRDAVKIVAKHLGNTPAICRSAYIDPVVLERFA